MPFSNNVQLVLVQGIMYVGGGGTRSVNDYIVMAYDISADKWDTLPPYQTCDSAMTAIDNQLLILGGYGRDSEYSKVVGAWRINSKKWTHPYPDMTTPRVYCSAVSYKHWVVVAGGSNNGNLSSIEVLNTDTKQWYAGPPTPVAWTEMKTAVVGDTCYYMGGYTGDHYTTKVYSASLPAIISQLNSDSSAKDTQTWKELPQLPVWYAAPLSISGSLLAVGGLDKDHKAMSTIHLYQPDTRQSVKVADMPTAQPNCTCLMITDKELLISGGNGNKQMDIAQI